jgi:hypothetical protein
MRTRIRRGRRHRRTDKICGSRRQGDVNEGELGNKRRREKKTEQERTSGKR